MNSLIEHLSESVIRAQSRIGLLPTVTQPTPDWNGPGVSALGTLGGVAIAVVLTLGVIGVITCGGGLILGHLASHSRLHRAAVIGLISSIAGIAVAGSAAGIVGFGQTLKVV